ncbi:MAG: phage major tail tube protein [Clostridia bacterium]|nr:phage major tail tube protein [Clostridia bacterium]
MSALGIPAVINDFNAYRSGNVLVGVTGEVTLPDLEAMTETISGPGILGEIDEAIIGRFSSMELEVPFRVLEEDIFTLFTPTSPIDLTLRAAEQYTDKTTSAVDYKGMRVVVRGIAKKLTSGTLKQGGTMDSSVTIELTYYMVEINGDTKVELDKLNGIYKVGGTDLLSKIKKLC